MATKQQNPVPSIPTGYDSRGNPFNIPVVQPSVPATAMVEPSPQVKLPQPKTATLPSQFVERLDPIVQQSQQGLVQAQTREAKQRDEVLGKLMNIDQTSTQSIYDSAFSKAGGDEFLKQFTDANTKLAQLQGKFRTAAQAVSSAPGQSQAFEGVQLNELSRQEAVEVGNQAILVQAMQGNLDSARQIALDTTRFATEDRQMELQNLLAQFDALQGIVQGQEAQLIEQKRIELQKELDDLNFTRDMTLSAISSGAATVEEMQRLNSLDTSNADKQALAQSILGRAADPSRQQVLSMAASYPDAGILPTDSLDVASSKLSRSRIYQEQVRPPVSGGSGAGSITIPGIGTLTNTQIDNISPLVTAFRSEPIVQNYNTIAEGYEFASSLPDTTENPADDQALIYSLAKALDPGSVVREGEYATVQKYAQSLVQSYGKSVTQAVNGSGFLSQDARRNIKETIRSRYTAAEKNYSNIYNETARRVELVGGLPEGAGTQFLNNYSGGYTVSPASPQPGSNNFVGPVNPSAQAQPQQQQNSDGWWKKATNWLFGD